VVAEAFAVADADPLTADAEVDALPVALAALVVEAVPLPAFAVAEVVALVDCQVLVFGSLKS